MITSRNRFHLFYLSDIFLKKKIETKSEETQILLPLLMKMICEIQNEKFSEFIKLNVISKYNFSFIVAATNFSQDQND